MISSIRSLSKDKHQKVSIDYNLPSSASNKETDRSANINNYSTTSKDYQTKFTRESKMLREQYYQNFKREEANSSSKQYAKEYEGDNLNLSSFDEYQVNRNGYVSDGSTLRPLSKNTRYERSKSKSKEKKLNYDYSLPKSRQNDACTNDFAFNTGSQLNHSNFSGDKEEILYLKQEIAKLKFANSYLKEQVAILKSNVPVHTTITEGNYKQRSNELINTTFPFPELNYKENCVRIVDSLKACCKSSDLKETFDISLESLKLVSKVSEFNELFLKLSELYIGVHSSNHSQPKIGMGTQGVKLKSVWRWIKRMVTKTYYSNEKNNNSSKLGFEQREGVEFLMQLKHDYSLNSVSDLKLFLTRIINRHNRVEKIKEILDTAPIKSVYK